MDELLKRINEQRKRALSDPEFLRQAQQHAKEIQSGRRCYKKTKVEQLIMIKHPYNVPLTEQCIRLLAHRHISSKDELKHELIQLGF